MTVTRIESFPRPIPRSVRAALRELHQETMPADTLPSFRRDNAGLIRVDGEPVAYVTWSLKRGRTWIDRIGVSEEFRGDGLAGRLLDFALNSPLPADAYIAAYNVASQRLFISRGFMPYASFEADKQTFIRFSTDPRKAPK